LRKKISYRSGGQGGGGYGRMKVHADGWIGFMRISTKSEKRRKIKKRYWKRESAAMSCLRITRPKFD